MSAEIEDGMRELVETIARTLVDHPDLVEVREVDSQHASIIELRVSKDDVGKIIGRQGAHAQAIRTLLSAASGKHRRRYTLEILDQ